MSTDRGRRLRGVATVAVLIGAACSAAAAAVPWASRAFNDPLSGEFTVSRAGSGVLPALVPLALVVIAAWAACAISRGVLSRVLAACCLAAGVATAVVAGVAAGSVSSLDLAADLRRPAEAVGPVHAGWAGIALAVVGGIVAAVGGAMLLWARPAVPRADRGYDAHDAPAVRRQQARREARQRTSAATPTAEVDAGTLWRSLDVGVDLTDDQATAEPVGPLSAPGRGRPSAPDTMGQADFPVDEEPTR